MELRTNQKQFISELASHYSHGSTAPLGVAPTGMGKTVCISYMANGAAKKGNRVGVIVHRQELVSQTSMALAKMGIFHGLVASQSVTSATIKNQIKHLGRSFYNSDAKVMVCSVQTLVRRFNTVRPFDFLMIDEAHHAVAGQWSKVIEYMPKAKLLGVTATPERLDGKGLGVDSGGCFTSLVMGPSVQSLMDDGFLAPTRVFAPPMQFEITGIRTRGGDFHNSDSAERLDKPSITGDVISHYNKLCPGQPAIAFCASVDHAKHVAENFKAAGYRAMCVDGGMHDHARRNAIEALATGHMDILTSCDIISEGTDVPVVTAALLLRPTKSLSLHLQQCGRVLRPYEGKNYAYIIDHVGNSLRLGLPEDERQWSLEGKKKRLAENGDQGPPVRQCLNCYACYPAAQSQCPNCGKSAVKEASKLEQVDGDLVEVDKQALKFQRKREQAQAQTLSELVELGRRRGMNNPHAWAKHIFKARTKKTGGNHALPL
ncbi:DEAD/DEAH box helicase [uncultured Kiloniella sp.]|uniref:DEAD/DEAH box helicase n=1 Tax=uncultured Kiloniella sp. TaxID=1133091 RepID=UPI002635B674|nr:DEAD/DEAH box helicase [uncultured Kiloniella sp.]